MYRTYSDFMKALLPDGKTSEEFYESPRAVIDELDAMERACYQIIDCCTTYDNRSDRAIETVSSEIAGTNVAIDRIDRRFQKFMASSQVDEDEYVFRSQSRADRVYDEMARVSGLVKGLYERCFGNSSDMNALGMMERLEDQLEEYYRTADRIDPLFIAGKQAVQMRLRREQQRIIKQEKQEQDAARKREQAMERATRPVKLRHGRPLVPRAVPVVHEKSDDEKLVGQRREQERIEHILFGQRDD
jgi:hypothetical protein